MVRRILMLSRGGAIGGSQRQLLHVVENLDRDRFQPTVVCTEPGPIVEQLGRSCQTFVRPLRPWRKPLLGLLRGQDVRWLARLAESSVFDVLYCSDLWMAPYLLTVASRLGRPVVMHVRAPMSTSRLRKYRCQQADALIAISPRARRQLVQAGVDPARIEVIYDSVNPDEFHPRPRAENVIRRDFPDARGPLVGIVGRIKPSKRQLEFVGSAGCVAGMPGMEAQFVIIGPEHTPAYMRQVQQAIAERGLQSRFVFTGQRDDMPEVLASLDVLVTLSGGSVMIEAMACGTPVISAGFTPPGESTIVLHERTGLVVEQDGLPDAMARLIGDADCWRRFGMAGREHVLANFGHLAMARKTQDLFARLCMPGAADAPGKPGR